MSDTDLATASPPPAAAGSGFGGWWARRSTGGRIVTVLVAALVLLNVGLSMIQGIVGQAPGGPAGSAVSTGGDGLRAYADLLERSGHQVTRYRRSLDADDLPPRSTAVVARVGRLEASDLDALTALLASGGRVVLLGGDAEGLLGVASSESGSATGPTWSRDDPVDRLAVWVPGRETGGATEVGGDEGGRWADLGGWLPLVGTPDGRAATVIAADVGGGRIVAVADLGPLRNDALGVADDAALGLGLVGAADAPVAFVEGGGTDGKTGLAAVPSSWRWAAAGTALTVLVGLWAAGARFGPAEPDRRLLRPARAEHVEAVAAELDRARSRRGEADLGTVPPADDPPGGPR